MEYLNIIKALTVLIFIILVLTPIIIKSKFSYGLAGILSTPLICFALFISMLDHNKRILKTKE